MFVMFCWLLFVILVFFFFQAEDGIRDGTVTGVQTCALPIWSGRVGLVFGLEAATPIENEIDRLDVLYGLGLRQIGIAYSDANALGSGLAETTDGGLTGFGRRAVARMNRLGLAIDLSHSSDRTALDVCRHSGKPVFLTHAGARSVWNTARMKPDDVLRAVADTGGVI